MAELIKPNIAPQKWLIKYQLEKLPTNQLLSKEEYLLATQIEEQFRLAEEIARAQLLDYDLLKTAYKNASFSHSMRRYQARLAIDTLVLLNVLDADIEKEARAIEDLAQKIAKNITNLSYEELLTSRTGAIEKSLREIMSWQLSLPLGEVSAIRERYQKILPNVRFTSNERDTWGHVEVRVNDKNFSWEFWACDIDMILRAVLKTLTTLPK